MSSFSVFCQDSQDLKLYGRYPNSGPANYGFCSGQQGEGRVFLDL